MKQLFTECRKYGLVRLCTDNEGYYYSIITFNTIDHVELQAKSGFDHEVPEDALLAALKKAIEIVESIQSNDIDTSQTRKLLE